MVTVKLFGLFRLDTGIKEFQTNADSVRALYPLLLDEARRIKPETTVTHKDIDGCIVMVNGQPCTKNSKLRDGDVVMLTSPVCGG